MSYLDSFLVLLPYVAVLWVYAGLILLRIIRKYRELEYKLNELIMVGCYITVSLLLPFMVVLPGWTVLARWLVPALSARRYGEV